MNILVVADGHYYRTPDGQIYVESVFDYSFYKRYLDIFENVKVIVRLSDVEDLPNKMKRVDGPGLEFLPLPNYRGAMQYIKNYFKIRFLLKKYFEGVDCAIFRIPGATANICCKYFAKLNKPFAIEVVVDPWEYFAKGTVTSKFRPLVRIQWTNDLKKLCLAANGVSYVTKEYLQKKYPCQAIIKNIRTDKYFTSSYSSVELLDDLFGRAKSFENGMNHIKLVHVANSFASYGKGHITVLKTLKYILDNGYSAEVKFVGDGPLKSVFEKAANKMNIQNNVVFIGRLSSVSEVREVMRKADLFLFPTMAEGLPRVLLEAMAEGLPCLSSPVCGIPEILKKEYLIDYEDYVGYGKKIIQLMNTENELEHMSKENLIIAKEFSKSKLCEKRRLFYLTLRNYTLNTRK